MGRHVRDCVGDEPEKGDWCRGPESDRRHYDLQASGRLGSVTQDFRADRTEAATAYLRRVLLRAFPLPSLLQPFLKLPTANLHVAEDSRDCLWPEGLGGMAMDTNLGAKAVGHLKLRRALSLQVSPEGLEKLMSSRYLSSGRELRR